MNPNTQRITVFPADGGLNKSLNQVVVPPNQLVEAKNIIFDLNGSRKKRPGIIDYVIPIGKPIGEFILGVDYLGVGITDALNMRGMFDYWRNINNSQSQRHIAVINGHVYTDNRETKGVFADITGSALISGADQVTFDVFTGLLVMGFESTTPKKWNMADTYISDLSASAPNGSIYRTHLGSGWIAGVRSNPHTVYFSAPGDPTVWTGIGTGSIDLDVGDRDPVGITSIFPSFFGDLYVSKRKSIYKIIVSGGSFAAVPVVKGIGCVAHNSAVSVNNDIIFASDRGVHLLSTTERYGNVESSFLSRDIHKYYIENVDFNYAKNMWAVYSPRYNSYFLAYTTRGMSYNTKMLCYDITGGKWYEWDNISCASICNFIDSNGRDSLMMGDHDGSIGYINDDIFTDFGESYPAMFKTGVIFPFGDPSRECSFKSINVYYKPKGDYNFTVSYRIDNQSTKTLTFSQSLTGGDRLGENFTLASSSLGGFGTFKSVKKSLQGHGCSIQLTFNQEPSSDTASEDLEIFGYSIEFESAGNTDKEKTL